MAAEQFCGLEGSFFIYNSVRLLSQDGDKRPADNSSIPIGFQGRLYC
jgi:hypothetical protein